MSPGDRSYDAIALMKQLSEHTASAYADALEVLGKDTPESMLKERRRSNDQNGDEENRSHLASNVLVCLIAQNFYRTFFYLLTSIFHSFGLPFCFFVLRKVPQVYS